jgi:hypothetical protein
LVAKLREVVPERLNPGRAAKCASVIGEDQVTLRFTPVRLDTPLQRGSEGLGSLLKERLWPELFAPRLKQLRPVPAYPAFGGFLAFAFDVPKNAVTALPTAVAAAS